MEQRGKILVAFVTVAVVVGVFYPPAGEMIVLAAPMAGIELGPIAEILPDFAELARTTSGSVRQLALFGLGFGSFVAVGRAVDRVTGE